MIKSSAVVLGGAGAAQLLALLFLPVISRVYSPEAFGNFHLYASAIMVLLPFAAFRLEYLILNLRSPRSLPALLALCTLVNVLAALVVYLCVRFALPILAPGASEAFWAGWVLPLGFFAAGMFQTTGYIAVRDKRYKLMAVSKIIQSGGLHGGGALTGAFFVAPSPMVLVLCDALSRFLAAGTVLIDWIKRQKRIIWRRTGLRMARILQLHWRYPAYSVPSSLFSAFATVLPVFWLSSVYSVEAAGQFGMAWRAGMMPLGMITYAVGQALNAELSEALRKRRDGSDKLILRTSAALVAVFALPLAIVFLYAEKILVVVLGGQWAVAGKMLEALTPLLMAAVIAGPAGMALVIAGRPGTHLMWEVMRAGLLIVIFLLSSRLSVSVLSTVNWYALTMLVSSLAYLLLVVKVIGNHAGIGNRRSERPT